MTFSGEAPLGHARYVGAKGGGLVAADDKRVALFKVFIELQNRVSRRIVKGNGTLCNFSAGHVLSPLSVFQINDHPAVGMDINPCGSVFIGHFRCGIVVTLNRNLRFLRKSADFNVGIFVKGRV